MGDISAMAQALMEQELARDPNQFRERPAHIDSQERTLSPAMLHTLGGLADAGSTYAFMKSGNGRETNPAVTAFAGNNPEKTLVASLAGLAATKGLTGLIGKKWPRVADALAANLGAEQLALAVNNTNIAAGQRPGDSFSKYGDTMVNAKIQSSKSQ